MAKHITLHAKFILILNFLVVLLVIMALHFQSKFHSQGVPQAFLNSIIFSVILQLLAFYPLKKLTEKEAQREVAADGHEAAGAEVT